MTQPSPSEPQLVQLLNPEGERVEHPTYSVDLSDEELRGLYRDLVLVRRVDAEATALQRQGELGIWASLLGQEAAQVGSGRAMREDDYAFPTYREHGVAWCRGVDPLNLLGLFRGVNHGGWDPNEQNFHLYTIVIGAQTLHATGYAMGMQKDGADERGHRLLRRRRHQPGRRQRGVHLRQRLQRAGRLLLPEQPVGHLRADREAEPHPALPAGDGLRLPGHPGRRQRRAGRARRHQGRAADTPARATGRPWSRRTPTGWARTRPPTTRPATGSPTSWSRGSSRTRSSAEGLPGRAPASPTRPTSTRSRRSPTSSRRTSARAASRCPTRSRCRSSTTCTPSGTRSWRRSARSSRAYLDDLRGRGEPLMTADHPRQGHQRWACARRWRATPRSSSWVRTSASSAASSG